MSFQIWDSEGKALTMKQLDIEVAQFWHPDDPTVDPKWYSSPQGNSGSNWFDTIGWAIHSPMSKFSGNPWKNVKITLWIIQTEDSWDNDEEKMTKEILASKRWLKPYFELIDHWASKGYTPKTLLENGMIDGDPNDKHEEAIHNLGND